MDVAFLIVVAINLCFLSGLIIYRLRAGGATAWQIALPVIELWVAFILWIAIFRSLSAAIGTPEAASAGGELQRLGERITKLPAATKTWLVAGVGISLAILIHLLWSMGRVMGGSIRK